VSKIVAFIVQKTNIFLSVNQAVLDSLLLTENNLL